MLIARPVRRRTGAKPVAQWAQKLLAWLLADPAGPGADRGVPVAVAVAVLVAAVIGHDLPEWIDRHGAELGTEHQQMALAALYWRRRHHLMRRHTLGLVPEIAGVREAPRYWPSRSTMPGSDVRPTKSWVSALGPAVTGLVEHHGAIRGSLG